MRKHTKKRKKGKFCKYKSKFDDILKREWNLVVKQINAGLRKILEKDKTNKRRIKHGLNKRLPKHETN